MARWMLGLMGWIVACSVHAGILYRWEATCVERYFLSSDYEGGRLELGCKQPIRGTLLMPDIYIPGTEYLSGTEEEPEGLPIPELTIFDTHFGPISIGGTDGTNHSLVYLPEQSGPGRASFLWTSGHIDLPGRTAFEIEANDSFVIVSEDAYFSRVSEPGTLSLAVLALGLAAARRWQGWRSSRPGDGGRERKRR